MEREIIIKAVKEIEERADKYIEAITDMTHGMRTQVIINGHITGYIREMERMIDYIKTYQEKLIELDARLMAYKHIAIETADREIIELIQDTDDRIQKYMR